MSSKLLTGLCFIDPDMEVGVVSINSENDDLYYPTIYFTLDCGESWEEISIQWEDVLDETYILRKEYYNFNKVYSLSIEDGKYVMEIGSGNISVKLDSTSLDGHFARNITPHTYI